MGLDPSTSFIRTLERWRPPNVSCRPEERIDFVSIVTPMFWPFSSGQDLLEAGFHVVCDKPMTFDLASKGLREPTC